MAAAPPCRIRQAPQLMLRPRIQVGPKLPSCMATIAAWLKYRACIGLARMAYRTPAFTPTLTSTASARRLAKGDRLCRRVTSRQRCRLLIKAPSRTKAPPRKYLRRIRNQAPSHRRNNGLGLQPRGRQRGVPYFFWGAWHSWLLATHFWYL